jgi:ankyrin repeat protein
MNTTFKYSQTPLMMAVYSRKLEIFRYLTEIDADIKILDHKKGTALHCAAQLGNVEIIKLLLNKGMSVNLAKSNGFTPLHI